MNTCVSAVPSPRHFGIMLCASLLLFAPAFYWGAGGVDLQQQSLWVKHFSSQFWQGNLYPRWLQGMNAGDGSPAFFYYSPLPYFITALFAFLLPLDPFGYTAIAASAFLSAVISGTAFYCLARQENAQPNAALVGSLLYMAAPNHLAQNFYYALLFGSVWAYAWVPLLFLFARRAVTGQPYAIAGFAVSLSLLIASNVPLAILFGPLAVIYGVVYCTVPGYPKQVLRLAAGTALGFALSAAYLLPAFMYANYANLDMYWSNNVPFARYFMHLSDLENSLRMIKGFFRGQAIDPHDANRALYELYWLCSALLLGFAWKVVPSGRQKIVFCTAALIALLLMLPASLWVWDNVPLIKTLQLSERLFATVTFCISLLLVYAWPRGKLLCYGLLVLYAAVTALICDVKHTTLEEYQRTHRLQYAAYSMQIEQYAAFLPTPDLMARYGTLEGIRQLRQDSAQLRLISGDAAVAVKEWSPRSIMLYYHASQPSVIRVHQLDFPGFRAVVEGNDLDVERDGETGRILIALPAGEGNISLKLTRLIPEIAGNALSLLSLGLLVLMVLMESRRRKITI